MFKVSFNKDSKKTYIVKDTLTKVTLSGKMKLPEWFYLIPNKITDWLWNHPVVGFDAGLEGAYINVSGKSVCVQGDSFDAVLGERIAESRAKLRLYKFMYTFTKMLVTYYDTILYGHHPTDIFYEKDTIYNAMLKYNKLHTQESIHLEKLLSKT